MTVRVIANRDKPRAHLLTVSASQEPIVDRAVTYGPSAATEGGPHFYPFLAENKAYKEPIVDRAVTYGPSAATEGGPHFYPFLAENKAYKHTNRWRATVLNVKPARGDFRSRADHF